ncbi:ABC transporter permease [Pseudochryseolinea flava]|uniref:ABC transporter permease n=1 Tax=Pseudochryseolinea flava TaxID=2059302 RepID=A0A364Y915_9BACT|nr:ABC transporter permease [Pseudochryseolinea flava]RAW02859.1 ABC transporter permease [Pseudochryseolinea flava]
MKEYPTLAERIIRAICPDHLVDQIEGDLIELYHHDVKDIGMRKAKWRLLLNALRFFRPGILFRNRFSNPLSHTHMLANYTKITFRVMARTKTFSAINISGLALGFTSALLLFLWIQFEFSFEQFHTNKDRLYIAWNRSFENGQINCWNTTPRVLAPTLQNEFAGVDHAVSFAQWEGTQRFKVGDKKMLKTSGVYTDPAFLKMLSFPLIKGNAESALEHPQSIVITEDFAYDLFGDDEAFGEMITVSEGEYTFELKVTGVLKKLPRNTAFNFDYIIPFAFLESVSGVDEFWGNNSVTTLVMTKEGIDESQLAEEIKDVEKKHFKDGQHIEIFLHPLLKSRLYSGFENGVQTGGKIDELKVIGILAVCLVLIGCINFVNLSTARAQKRAKEISVRKVTGAVRRSLIMQFIVESIIMCSLAASLSLVLSYLLLPWFNIMMYEQLSFQEAPIWFWGCFAAAVLSVGLVAGGYPAFYLSSLSAIRVFKFSGSGKMNQLMRSGLVVVQFGFAIMLMVGATVVFRQSQFLRAMDQGYDTNRLAYVPITGDMLKNFTAFKNELLTQGFATSVTRTSTPFTEQWSSTGGMQWAGKNPEERTNIERIVVDEEIVSTSSLTLIAGRDLDLDKFPSDSNAVVINESAWRLMNFENPIGETIKDNGKDWKIVGVVKDFVFVSPFMRKSPVVLFGCEFSEALSFVYIKLDDTKSLAELKNGLEKIHRQYNVDYPFELHFADLEYAQKFEILDSMKMVSAAATLLAIFIASIGLLGMAMYMIEVKKKEIGIRKVLGGSVYSIIKMLSISSLKPIAISVLIFAPLAWLAMTAWLELFPYRIDLEVWIFVLATILILFVALFTVTTQTAKAAYDNPVNSLKSE